MKNGECVVIKDEWTPKLGEYLNLPSELRWLHSSQKVEDLKKPIPKDWLTGIKFKTKSYDKISEYETIADKPYLELTITSFKGAIGAMHYYGRLELQGFHTREISQKSHCYIFGFLGSKDTPDVLELLDLEITVEKDIEKWEIKKYPDRYKSYRIGDKINAHWDKKSIIKIGKEIHEKYFGDFKLEINDYA